VEDKEIYSGDFRNNDIITYYDSDDNTRVGLFISQYPEGVIHVSGVHNGKAFKGVAGLANIIAVHGSRWKR